MAISIEQGDLVTFAVDAIVNPSNESLVLGSGVSGAIARAGGPTIQEEMDAIGHCERGKAVITGAGTLPCRNIIHTVGPIYSSSRAGECADLLRDAIMNSLECLHSNGLTSIAFPAISTGVYGYPVAEAAEVMLETALEWLLGQDRDYSILFVLWTQDDWRVFRAALAHLLGE
jgi:serine/threonine-protein kinase